MKKLCFSLICHAKSMVLGGFSSLGGCAITPTCSPGPGTSFMRFMKVLKILKFLNRKFRHRIFANVSKILVMTKILVILGNPIEIYSKPENYKYRFEISDWRKFYGGILIINSKILFFMFIWPKIMFLGQGSKYNGKLRPTDPNNLQKPCFFHDKSRQIIAFSWFSLSELPYSKSQQPTCLPRVHSRDGFLFCPAGSFRSSSVVGTLLKLRLRRHLPRGKHVGCCDLL